MRRLQYKTMRHRTAKCTVVLILLAVTLLLAWLPSAVLAIADPDTLWVRGVYVFEDCLEDGDVGVLVEYEVDYTVLPSEVVTEAYLVIFIDSDGTTQLAATAPYAYVDNGFGRGAAWIYFTAAEATSYALSRTDMADYRIRLSGNPTVPSGWTGDPPGIVTDITYWQDGGTTSTLFGLRVLEFADNLGVAWGLALSEPTTIGYRLSDTGAEYFCNVIPGLRSIAPSIFQEGTIDPIDVDQDRTTRFGAVLTDITGTALGSPVTLTEGTNTVNILTTGTFNIELEQGTVGNVTGGTATVQDDPVDLVAGSNTLTVTATGTILIYVVLQTTQTTITDATLGTAFDLTTLGEHFSMSRLWISGVVWFILTILICAAVYKRTEGADATRTGKIVFIVFDVCVIGGILLGMLSIIVGVLVFLACNAFIGYILFFRQAHV